VENIVKIFRGKFLIYFLNFGLDLIQFLEKYQVFIRKLRHTQKLQSEEGI
jgi:hypothetical protein